jgi:hypothetical protein
VLIDGRSRDGKALKWTKTGLYAKRRGKSRVLPTAGVFTVLVLDPGGIEDIGTQEEELTTQRGKPDGLENGQGVALGGASD